tara:strand:- start:1164 stop:1349 length:186 start_codon:yes stop_codon:yes gene_type:complete
MNRIHFWIVNQEGYTEFEGKTKFHTTYENAEMQVASILKSYQKIVDYKVYYNLLERDLIKV